MVSHLIARIIIFAYVERLFSFDYSFYNPFAKYETQIKLHIITELDVIHKSDWHASKTVNIAVKSSTFC